MTLAQIQEKALELPVTERRELVKVLRSSLDSESEAFPLTDAQRQMLDRRRAEYFANPESALTWAELQARLDDPL